MLPVGGGHNQVAVMRLPLEERGWEVLALVPSEPGNAADRLREAGVETIELPMGRLRASLDPRLHTRFVGGLHREIRSIERLVRQRSIDLVQAHGVTHVHGPLGADAAGAAVVWELYDTRAPMALRRVLMPLVTRKADVITTWGRGLGEVHPGSDSLGERWVPVFPPTDAQRFRPDSPDGLAAREEMGVPPRRPVGGNDRKLEPPEGPRVPHRGRRRFQSGPEAYIRVVGAPGRVHTAHLPNLKPHPGGGRPPPFDSREPEHSRAHACGVRRSRSEPSVPRSEGIPTVILEAMSSGVPVVSTDVGAVSELIEEGETGYVVPPHRPDLLAEKLELLLSDPGLRAKMGRIARQRVLEHYALDKCADRRAGAFDLALAHRRAPTRTLLRAYGLITRSHSARFRRNIRRG